MDVDSDELPVWTDKSMHRVEQDVEEFRRVNHVRT